MGKIDISLQNHFICNHCTKEEAHTIIFYNNDDNVCTYCGSKDTKKIYQAKLKGK